MSRSRILRIRLRLTVRINKMPCALPSVKMLMHPYSISLFADEIFKYKRLFDAGAITRKEYEAKEENNDEGTNCKCITQT